MHGTGSGVSLRLIEEASGRVTTVFDHLRMKTSGWKTKQEAAARKEWLTMHNAQCTTPVEFFERSEQILGHNAAVVSALLADGRKVTEWRLPEFGCVTLKASATLPDGKLWYSIDPVYFTAGNPRVEHFIIPSHFREAKPSEVHAVGASGGSSATRQDPCPGCSPLSEPDMKRLDEQYGRRQIQP